MTIQLKTSRLMLREMSLGDLDFIAALLADPQVMRFYPKCYSRDEAQAWVQRNLDRYARDGHGLWLVSLRETAEPIGQVGLVMQTVDDVVEPEIGYMVARNHWNRGYAREAATAVREFAHRERGYRRVISLVRPINIPSQRTALSLGMKPERLTMFRELEHLVFAMS